MSEQEGQTTGHEPALTQGYSPQAAFPTSPSYSAPMGGVPQFPGYAPPVPQSGKATAVLVLGILGLVFVFCYVVPGLVMGIIALALSTGARREIAQSGGRVGGEGALKAGVTCAWVSVGLGVALIVILAIAFVVGAVTN